MDMVPCRLYTTGLCLRRFFDVGHANCFRVVVNTSVCRNCFRDDLRSLVVVPFRRHHLVVVDVSSGNGLVIVIGVFGMDDLIVHIYVSSVIIVVAYQCGIPEA